MAVRGIFDDEQDGHHSMVLVLMSCIGGISTKPVEHIQVCELWRGTLLSVEFLVCSETINYIKKAL